MHFDTDNKIFQLCSKGMMLEGEGKKTEALTLFQQAWDQATNDIEKFTAAHYLARQQETIAGKLEWDQKALQLALGIDDPGVKETYPSLYLNIAKGYEDLKDIENARKNYQTAFSFTGQLRDDGYGKMIKSGIINGIERVR